MSIKFRTWKYADSKKIFIKSKKTIKLITKDLCFVYDTRNSIDFQKIHFKNSKNISPIIIKGTILKHEITEKILLVGNNLKTNMIIASWARYKGYKNVFLISQLINEFPKKILTTKRKRN